MIRLLFTNIFVLLLLSNALSQNYNAIDSITAAITKAKDTQEGTHLFNSLAREYLCFHYDSAQIFAEMALTEARNIDDTDEIMDAMFILAHVHMSKGEFDRSIYYQVQAFNLSTEKNNERGMALSQAYLSRLDLMANDLSQARVHLMSTKSLMEKVMMREVNAIYYENLGLLLNKIGEIDSAYEMLSEAMSLFEYIDDKESIARVLNHFGVINKVDRNYSRSLNNHLLALEMYKKLKHKEGMAFSLFYAGEVYYEEDQRVFMLNSVDVIISKEFALDETLEFSVDIKKCKSVHYKCKCVHWKCEFNH